MMLIIPKFFDGIILIVKIKGFCYKLLASNTTLIKGCYMKSYSRTHRQQRKTANVKTNDTKGEVRIIAGKYRGRKLPVLVKPGLRPTGDRIKETLFNWLMPEIVGARCLDCFAGSGALGFEALSRQASAVQFLEFDQAVAKQLDQNVARLNCDNATVIHADSLDYLAKGNQSLPFDIIFLDPPFGQDFINRTLPLLEQNWVKTGSWVYLESELSLTHINIPTHWLLHREKKVGNVAFRLFKIT